MWLKILSKKQRLAVIEWKDESNDIMAYRFPLDKEIMTGSSLTVRESQAAVFVSNGVIADVLMPGMHKLQTSNIPILTQMLNLVHDGNSKFKAEVYFVNTRQFSNQKWGTTNPITMRDQDFGIVRIRGYGTFSFKVVDPAKFLKEAFATGQVFTVDKINEQLKSFLISVITDTIVESKVSALDLAGNLQEFNELCKKHVQDKFASFGFELVSLVIENISFPKEIEEALDQRTTLGILGDKMGVYAQKAAADALGDAAKNGSGGPMGTFIGMGLGQQMGGTMAGAFGNIQNAEDAPKKSKGGKFCPKCGASCSTKAKFCPECGEKFASAEHCANCGAEVKPSAKFCPECGEKQE